MHVPKNFTVERLKDELSETLPSKPSKEMQLIHHNDRILLNSENLWNVANNAVYSF